MIGTLQPNHSQARNRKALLLAGLQILDMRTLTAVAEGEPGTAGE